MLEKFTLVIPTHNRCRYLSRILNYYETQLFSIIIVDSSLEVFNAHEFNSNIKYFHTPKLALPEKLSFALKMVDSEFVAFLADDDFLIPQAIEVCINFLSNNVDYSSAQGNALLYKLNSLEFNQEEGISYIPMYPWITNRYIQNEKWKDRLVVAFENYRSYFYAVHRTEILKKVYNETTVVGNLFLNEYLSTIIPICLGKFAELNILFQVREWVEDSDDKTTLNIDLILNDHLHKNEVSEYLDFISNSLCISGDFYKEEIVRSVLNSLQKYASFKPSQFSGKKSFRKRVGFLIAAIPLVGKRIIQKNRTLENRNNLKKVVKNISDENQLNEITAIIKKYYFH